MCSFFSICHNVDHLRPAENWRRQNKGNNDQTARWLQCVKNRTRPIGSEVREPRVQTRCQCATWCDGQSHEAARKDAKRRRGPCARTLKPKKSDKDQIVQVLLGFRCFLMKTIEGAKVQNTSKCSSTNSSLLSNRTQFLDAEICMQPRYLDLSAQFQFFISIFFAQDR